MSSVNINKKQNLRVAFIVGSFPEISETFIIDQACDLIDRGVGVEIYAFNRGGANKDHISKRYFQYGLDKKTMYLSVPANKILRIIMAGPRLVRLLLYRPASIFKIASNFKVLFWDLKPFFGKKYDLYHCHFGNVGSNFVMIKKVLGIKEKFITSLYGQDVSKRIKEKGIAIYRGLIEESALFFVMSEDMKRRVVGHGFSSEKVLVHPIGINLDNYNFKERAISENKEINIVSVGRFVEKKGFDDLLRALAIVKEKTSKKFRCYMIGDGPLREKIHSLAGTLGLNDVVEFKGFMAIERILDFFQNMSFFVQPSKTAKDGDTE
ncbi:MAG: hypothetical protein A3B91_03200 [Candidatus Yanofskybacteria bacterium RIFCSPHIGHO2_02_FULL_41_29]|uniref:Glycosyl transferase family 1 domain-containing protein n=1 Tax=Candidatus Yanofskybacteria bacterium RIFCSPHIGHO2_01_FULL_41_53 TaxID=1802663 RepID=A0A1F8EGK8_9BACT|nr:MAG: hypothetical protein A2650_01025 [Candidatus Yanofskybacteria bacterium RIFCSPHIGHO2_01_FULL_41_53]OGN10670.1 MAG: hypothetical protein A3B91_03200 [Candidatus Yanofskybacteria bacterium RIFCSPHIGHO2_02_FULL_41_29]OGN18118.1 MAG: hypothetical protein A3F48_02215 [Candidatus Yanofskybacteria bacterium RIFCSPHIGHO2_12_FULL_41_9]OGN24072.1 MAG: hypothetical protein A2916_04930 [Candidatus Yanofskybacteria bacterium RIFCSPLOWO2_01_FULL_41_67]OGN30469.1 MAG: hypothetical protein A3H54_00370 